MEIEAQPNVPSDDPIRRQQDLAREQIAGAWQIHVEHVREQLDQGWRAHIERVLSDRLEAVSTAAREEIERQVAERVAEETARLRDHLSRIIAERLNQSARRLDQAEDSAQWSAALLDAATAFAPSVVLLSCLNAELKYEGDRMPDAAASPDSISGFRAPLAQIPAAVTVSESLDTVIAMATPGELSEPLAAALGAPDGSRICLIPITVGRASANRRVVAILFAWNGAEPVDVNILELLCSLAGATLDASFERGQATTAAPAGQVVNITPVQAIAAPPAPELPAVKAAPAFSSLSREDQELHSRAQRFARVRVAEMRLYQPEQVRNGRENNRLYMALRGEMDRSRTQFKHEFMHSPSMIDYFHMEIIRTLANDDEFLLGVEYPGPLC